MRKSLNEQLTVCACERGQEVEGRAAAAPRSRGGPCVEAAAGACSLHPMGFQMGFPHRPEPGGSAGWLLARRPCREVLLHPCPEQPQVFLPWREDAPDAPGLAALPQPGGAGRTCSGCQAPSCCKCSH